MAKAICFASPKGGAGKTTIAASIATLIASFDKKVLLIDFDEATNGLSLLYLKEIERKIESSESPIGLDGMFPLFSDIPDVVSISENLDLVPASYRFKINEQGQVEDYHKRIAGVVEYFRFEYDFLIIDAQAGSDAASLASTSADVSDLVVLVSEYDPMSAAGIERLKSLSPNTLNYERTYTLINKMLPEFSKSFHDFFSMSHYLPPVPWTEEAVRAYANRQLAIDTEKGNEFTLAMLQVVKSLPIPSLNEAYSGWVAERAPLIRQPLEEQYEETMWLLRSTTEQLLHLENFRRSVGRFERIFHAAVPGVIVVVLAFVVGPMLKENFEFLGNLDGRTDIFLVFGFALIASIIGLIVANSAHSDDYDVDSLLEAEKLGRQKEIYTKKLQELEFLISASDHEFIEKSFSRQSTKSASK